MSQSTMLPTGICTGTSTKTAENADEKQPQPDFPRAEAVLMICYIRAVSTVPMRMASTLSPKAASRLRRISMLNSIL